MVVGISGASGFVYGFRLLEILQRLQIETHVVVSRSALLTMTHETDYKLADIRDLANYLYKSDDMAASISSGSFRTMGMVVAPCSMKTLAEIAHGLSGSLVSRAGDVTLKERRKLVLLVRETPLTQTHIANMLTVTQMGAIVTPPVPAFYVRPASIAEIVDHTVGRVLDLFDLETGGVRRWLKTP
ncbi:polyprenyl P-hydroxybenzoate and phenylacrylic acid decarboxylase family protein (plasmid) [Ochrobactrum quorumnocens]|uniref:Flavin prenyltransferase UbiX n=2 Tax=Ochrobactrum quorumnocens TaxID=271865 RepID=A0A248UN69_9HYPH|nr:polyprenyl P-hydroxybenzoate and phenylacrylic acid decarboxylase family protein [[Ochrobactrum] quorumnocens]